MKTLRWAGFGRLKQKLLASLTLGLALLSAFPAFAQDAAGPKTLTVLNYVTGWTHDAVGYHPALFMLLENSCGRDLTNKPIRFQARFTDLHTAEVTIGRAEVRRDLKPHQQFSLAIEGAQGYELPFEVYQWPSIETKAMCRIGSSGDEGTETLTIAKVDPVARTTTEAFESLNQATSFKPNEHRSPGGARPVAAQTPLKLPEAKPLKAAPALKAAPERSVAVAGDSSAVLALLNSKSLPGLGDDFYNFEQRFGMPQSFDAKHSEWTWAKYRHSQSGAEVIAGAKDHGGKVDVIVVKVSRASGIDEAALVGSAKQFSGKLKSQPLSSPSKSVRYLPSGRVELMTSTSTGYKVVCLTPEAEDSDNSFILVLSRVAQDPDTLLPQLASKSDLLKCLRFLEQRD